MIHQQDSVVLGPVQAKRIAQNVLNLPTLPTVVAKMMEIMDDPRTTVVELSKLISSDQVLAAKLLRLANSAYFGMPRKVSTLDFAIVLLGFENVKSLALSLSVIDKFSENWNGHFDYTEFWEHAFGCAVASRLLAKTIAPTQTSEAFVAGLLHDIGKLILSQYATKYFSLVVEKSVDCGAGFDEIEKATLGVTHAEIGGWFAERWNFPLNLISAIGNHHTLDVRTSEKELALCVHIGDFMVRQMGVGFEAGKNVPIFHASLFDGFSLQRNEIGKIDFRYYAEQLQIELEESDSFLNFITRGLSHAEE